ncbi:MAG: ABC transporter permease [Lachnospiraceae bacterium]|nr:ABC transporter permease [Lachnospiraceae bacterium]
MKKTMALIKRNLLLYFKNKQSVFFSLLTSILVFGLYLLFLKGNYVTALNNVVEQNPGLKGLITDGDINAFSNMIMLVGVLGAALVTVPFHCLSTAVNDRERKIDYDISATPIKRWQIVVSYFVSAAISSIIMISVILTLGLVVLKAMGGLYLTTKGIAAAYGVIVLGSISGTAFFMPIILLYKDGTSLGAFFGIISAVSGFVIGAYIPLSEFSEGIRNVCGLFPGAHITSLLRVALTGDVLNKMDAQIGGLDQGMFVSSIKTVFPFETFAFGRNFDTKLMIIYIFGMLALCIALMILVYAKNYKRK